MLTKYKNLPALLLITVFFCFSTINLQPAPTTTTIEQTQQQAGQNLIVKLPQPDPSSTPATTPSLTTTPKALKTYKNISPTLKASPSHPQVPYYLLATVNDPFFGSSWFHNKIQTNRGWDLSTGSNAVTVAVIDTGFELNHEDFTDRWYQNTGETGQTQNGDICWTGSPAEKPTNNCDDDQNGYIDDWSGFDFFYNDNNPQAGQINPIGEGTQHGSLVAGVVGATANNNKGSVGIDQNTKIMPLQVFSDNGEAYTDDLVSAIDYATDMNANVINLSLGSNQFDATLLSAINRAHANGTLVIAASGNCALNDEEFCNNLTAPGRMTYPALYNNVLAVGATDTNDVRSNFSSYGSELDVVAPGQSIGPLPVFNNGNTNSYATANGTSFAAPIVSGTASLLIAQNPNITISELNEIITNSTDTTPEMNGQFFKNEYGFGRVNTHKASLLSLAKTQTNLLGSEFTQPALPPIGNLWRASSSPVANDEWLLFGCRTYQTDYCSVTLTNNNTKYQANSLNKSDQIRYIFIKGSAMNNSGAWTATAHNNYFASNITSFTK